MNQTSDVAKRAVLQRIGGATPPIRDGRSKFRIGRTCIHARFKSTPSSLGKYPFNINPNTLSADCELWICGDSETYYLVPISIIRKIYDHPEGYVDCRHPDIRVVTVDTDRHHVTYARGGQFIDVAPYFQETLA